MNAAQTRALWDSCQLLQKQGKLTNHHRAELKRALGLNY